MSAHMKARRTNGVEVKIGTKNPKLFVVPKDKAESLAHLLEEYETSPSADMETVSVDEVFRELNEKYTRPGSVLRGARLKEELSQVELANKLGISQADLSKMEHGTRGIGKAMAKRLAKILKINYRVFL
jgi:ribosome-binding protein aMBF1 (putative translation factor)